MFLNKFFLALMINKLSECKKIKSLMKNKSDLHLFLDQVNTFSTQIFEKIYICSQKLKCLNFEKNFMKKIVFLPNSIGKFLENEFFKKFMCFCTLLSFIAIGFHDPFEASDGFQNQFLICLDYALLSIFLIEFLLNLIFHIRNQTHKKLIFLFSLCLVYILSIFLNKPLLKIFIILRLFFLMSPFKSLKFAIRALIFSLPDILPLFTLFFFVIFVFALLGTRLFKNELFYCNNVGFGEMIIDKYDCFDYGGDWVNSDFSFDDFIKAIDLLFAIANSSGWLPLMYY